jgi:hypothetical protein
MFGPTRVLVFGCPLLVVALGTALAGVIVASSVGRWHEQRCTAGVDGADGVPRRDYGRRQVNLADQQPERRAKAGEHLRRFTSVPRDAGALASAGPH